MQEKRFKVLFLGADSADYLNILTLNGLKELPNIDLYTYPEPNLLYKKRREAYQESLRGKGFSIFFLNEESNKVTPHYLFDLIESTSFDLIILGDIFYFYPLYLWLDIFNFNKDLNIVILDGSDQENLFPYSGFFYKKLSHFFLPRVLKRHLYFKRELTKASQRSRFYNLLPSFITDIVPMHKNLREISFSFPGSKIINPNTLNKTKLFMNHIVDEEIQSKVNEASSGYIFNNEEAYYSDIQKSKYGITTKRSGWDCLRHYEIAANGAVICFKDLDLKPPRCAPHDLVPGQNCLSYKCYKDLKAQIESIDEEKYKKILNGSYEWILSKTSMTVTKKMLFESGIDF